MANMLILYKQTIEMLKNPVIQLLECFAFCFMFLAFDVLIRRSKKMHEKSVSKQKVLNSQKDFLSFFRKISAIACFILALSLLWLDGTYIRQHFETVISTLFYQAYLPPSHENYYQWRYSLTVYKMVVCLLLIPMGIPFLYAIRQKLFSLKKRVV